MGSRRVGLVRGTIFAKGYTLEELAERVAKAIGRRFNASRLRKLYEGNIKDVKEDEVKAMSRLLDLTPEQVRGDLAEAVVARFAKAWRRAA